MFVQVKVLPATRNSAFSSWIGDNPANRIVASASALQRNETVNALRALAMLLVFAFHLRLPENLEWSRHLAAFWSTIAPLATNIFLTICGVFIYRECLAPKTPYGQYVRKRLRRILPTFWAVLVIYVAASLVFPDRSRIPAEPWAAGWFLIKQLLLAGYWLGDPLVISTSWTLHYIVLAYLLFPLVVAGLFLPKCPAPLRFTALFLLLAAVVALLEDRRAATFILLGALVWELSNAFHWLRLMALEACLTLWACFVPIGWLELTAFHLCLAVMLFASPQRVWLLSWLGDRSYSFYLCHGLGIGMVRLVLDHGAPTWRSSSLWIFAYVITALIGAFFWTILVYELIEKRRKRVTRTEPESQPASKPATGAATERIPLPVGGAVPALKATGA